MNTPQVITQAQLQVIANTVSDTMVKLKTEDDTAVEVK